MNRKIAKLLRAYRIKKKKRKYIGGYNSSTIFHSSYGKLSVTPKICRLYMDTLTTSPGQKLRASTLWDYLKFQKNCSIHFSKVLKSAIIQTQCDKKKNLYFLLFLVFWITFSIERRNKTVISAVKVIEAHDRSLLSFEVAC